MINKNNKKFLNKSNKSFGKEIFQILKIDIQVHKLCITNQVC